MIAGEEIAIPKEKDAVKAQPQESIAGLLAQQFGRIVVGVNEEVRFDDMVGLAGFEKPPMFFWHRAKPFAVVVGGESRITAAGTEAQAVEMPDLVGNAGSTARSAKEPVAPRMNEGDKEQDGLKKARRKETKASPQAGSTQTIETGPDLKIGPKQGYSGGGIRMVFVQM